MQFKEPKRFNNLANLHLKPAEEIRYLQEEYCRHVLLNDERESGDNHRKKEAERTTGKNMHERLKDLLSMIRLHQYLIKSALTEVEFERVKTQFDVSANLFDSVIAIIQSIFQFQ